jgi:septal ring factor EnvC (AmiA/AmiB activator)
MRLLRLTVLLLFAPALLQVRAVFDAKAAPAERTHATAAKESLEKTQADLADSRAKAEALAQQLSRAKQSLESVQNDSARIGGAVKASEEALSKNERRIRTLTLEVMQRESRLKSRESEGNHVVIGLLQARRLPLSSILCAPDDRKQTLLRTVAIMDAVRGTLERDAIALRNDLTRLRAAREELVVTQRRYQNTITALAKKREMLASKLEERAALQATLGQNYRAAGEDATRLAREAASLQQLIAGLNNTQSTPAQKNNIPPRGTPTAPASGAVLHRFGENKSGSDTWRGMVFRTRPSAVVVAPAGAEIAFTGNFMDYGPMVLLRHKGGMMSLVAGLERIDVRTKQSVRSGEPLGIMAATGEQNLYVELREAGKPIDPERWFAKVTSSFSSR